MNIYNVLVIVAFLICATIVICRIIDYYLQKLKGFSNYWHGRYESLWEVFNKAVKYDLSDDMMSDIEEIIEKNT